MIDDIVLNKTEIINRCIRRVTEEYAHNPQNFTFMTNLVLGTFYISKSKSH